MEKGKEVIEKRRSNPPLKPFKHIEIFSNTQETSALNITHVLPKSKSDDSS
jgi:hypothetical protein